MDRAKHFERLTRIRYRITDQRSLVWSCLSFLVARPGVPCRRHYRLVIVDLPILNDDPVGQGAARRLMEAIAPQLAFGKMRLIENRPVSFGDIVRQEASMLQSKIGEHRSAYRSCEMAAQRAVQGFRPDLRMRNAARRRQSVVEPVFGWRMIGCVSHHHL